MVNPEATDFWSRQKTPEQLKQPQKIEAQQEPVNQPESSNPESANHFWSSKPTPTTYVDPKKFDEESSFGYVVRNVLSNASRVAEGALGGYGNLKEMVENLAVKYPKATGFLGYGLYHLMGPEKWEQMIKGRGDVTGNISPPSSSDLRQNVEELTGSYTKPRTKVEGALQELSSDIGATLTPGLKMRGPRINRRIPEPVMNHVLIPAAANAVKQGAVEGLGFKEDKGEIAKMASWMTLSLLGSVDARQFANSLMNDGRQGMPAYLSANVNRLINNLRQAERQMLSNDPRTALAISQIRGIENDIANGQTSVRDLMNRYDSINATKRSKGMFEIGRADQAYARNAIDTVLSVVRNEIEHLGQNAPNALRSWQNGLRAQSVIHRSQSISNYVQDLAKTSEGKFKLGAAGVLFTGGATKAALATPALTGAVGATGAAGYKTAQIAYRVINDPNLARYYWNAITAAEANNANAFIKNYNQLEKGLEEDDRKKGKPPFKVDR